MSTINNNVFSMEEIAYILNEQLVVLNNKLDQICDLSPKDEAVEEIRRQSIERATIRKVLKIFEMKQALKEELTNDAE